MLLTAIVMYQHDRYQPSINTYWGVGGDRPIC